MQLYNAYAQSGLSFPSSTSSANINLPLPGLSEHIANPIIFYEKFGFGAHVSFRYRSEFVISQIGIGELILTSAPETVIDKQVNHEFPKDDRMSDLTLIGPIDNATDEPTRTYFSNHEQTGTIQNFGRTFNLGATVKC